MQAHALEARPAECCGLLSGNGQLITSLYPLRNEADCPETRYFASPEDILAAMRKIREDAETMMGIYHSHPRTPPYPSKSDVELAFYFDSIYFIVSLAAWSQPAQSLPDLSPPDLSLAERLRAEEWLPHQSADGRADIRAFRIRDGQVTSVDIVVTESEDRPIGRQPGD